ncbi:MAG: TlpA family protein disulfide reductase [Hyphomicrobiales bacterium]|nr:TlpA family protein disulfide reductase [Hyphomicrobiales bacterium]
MMRRAPSPSAAKPSRPFAWLSLFFAVLFLLTAQRMTRWGLSSEGSPDLVELHGADRLELSPLLDEKSAEAPLASFRGKVLILNLWAPWCLPCLQEMPALDRLAGRLPEERFAVAAVTKDAVGDSPAKRAFDSMGLSHLRLYLDPKGVIQGEVRARGFPTTVIVGPDGASLAYREGAGDWDSPQMIARLEAFAKLSGGSGL